MIWLHVTLLDLLYVNRHGAYLLWEEGIRPSTLLTHLLIAITTVFFYLLVIKLSASLKKESDGVDQKAWFYCSAIMIFTLGLLMY